MDRAHIVGEQIGRCRCGICPICEGHAVALITSKLSARIRQRESHTRDVILGFALHQLAKSTGPRRTLPSNNLFPVQPLSKRSLALETRTPRAKLELVIISDNAGCSGADTGVTFNEHFWAEPREGPWNVVKRSA